jgi:hypothetical protein
MKSNCDCDSCNFDFDGCLKECGGDVGGLLIILLVVAISMAAVGLLVGLLFSMVVCQRIIQRHIYLLHKRQLVQEFQVVDLAGYDLDQPEKHPSLDIG